jgi:hypothetical protein
MNSVSKMMSAIAGFGVLVSVIVQGWQGFYITIVLSICIAAFSFANKLLVWIISKDDKQRDMKEVSDAIREGSFFLF